MIPNVEHAEISDAKLRDYLLSTTHPVGRFKAYVFLGLGFLPTNIDPLRTELLRIARESEETTTVASPHGTKFVARGILTGPNGGEKPQS